MLSEALSGLTQQEQVTATRLMKKLGLAAARGSGE
jgi:hypothetical protein